MKTIEDDMEEVFPTEVVKMGLDDSQIVTVQLKSGCYVRFQVDNGAQCNVLPVLLYQKATKDYNLAQIDPVKSNIIAYGGATLPVVGTAAIQVYRGNKRYNLHCNLVDNLDIRPLMGRQACLQMKLVSYLDNDELNKPIAGNLPVYALEMKMTSSKD